MRRAKSLTGAEMRAFFELATIVASEVSVMFPQSHASPHNRHGGKERLFKGRFGLGNVVPQPAVDPVVTNTALHHPDPGRTTSLESSQQGLARSDSFLPCRANRGSNRAGCGFRGGFQAGEWLSSRQHRPERSGKAQRDGGFDRHATNDSEVTDASYFFHQGEPFEATRPRGRDRRSGTTARKIECWPTLKGSIRTRAGHRT